MKKNNKIIFVLLILFLIQNSSLFSATSCEQTFTFLLLNRENEPVFWIIEDLSGECSYSRIVQVVISDNKAKAVRTSLEKYKNWQWLKEGTKHIRQKIAIPLENDNGTWISENNHLKIIAPPKNNELYELFVDHIRIGGSSGVTWNRENELQGILLPIFDGMNSELVYYYPIGLYINYEINEVYYFPNTGLILVFTNQPKKAVGLNSMHGFFIFKKTK